MLDEKVCKPILEAIKTMEEPVSIAVLPDHPTPCAIRTHSSNPVPFMIYRPDVVPDEIQEMSECTAENGYYGILSKDEFIKEFLKK